MTPRILMVCLGNICRSPIAEVVFKKKLQEAGLSWTVRSAGTNRYHKGGPADERAIEVCRLKGVDLTAHIARRLTPADFEQYDILFSMAEDVTEEMLGIVGDPQKMKRVYNFMDALHPGQKRSVPDPWYGGPEGFVECWDLIDELSEKWLAELRKRFKS